MNSELYPNPNDCDECDAKDCDSLYYHRSADQWLCDKCCDLRQLSRSCFSCEENHE